MIRQVPWFTESRANRIGKIAKDGTIREYRLRKPGSFPTGIIGEARYNDGGAWFVEMSGNRIGHITRDGAITEYPIPTPNSQPVGIAESETDGSIWFTERGSNAIGKLRTDGQITEYRLPTNRTLPGGIVFQYWGLNPAMWFSETGVGKVGIVSAIGQIRELPVRGNPSKITTAVGPTFWYADAGTGGVGVITEGDPPSPGGLFAIGKDQRIGSLVFCTKDQAIWATEPDANAIARINVFVPSYW